MDANRSLADARNIAQNGMMIEINRADAAEALVASAEAELAALVAANKSLAAELTSLSETLAKVERQLADLWCDVQAVDATTPAPPSEAWHHGGMGGGDDDGYDMTGLNGGPTHRDVRNWAAVATIGDAFGRALLSYVDRCEQAERACSKCGNKRCPRATFHGNDCSGSNEPGQLPLTDTPGGAACNHSRHKPVKSLAVDLAEHEERVMALDASRSRAELPPASPPTPSCVHVRPPQPHPADPSCVIPAGHDDVLTTGKLVDALRSLGKRDWSKYDWQQLADELEKRK